MKYLLDTHTFLWTLFEPDNISAKARDIIIDSSTDLCISIVSLWEMSLKYNLVKLELNNITPDELPNIAKNDGFDIFHLNEYDVSSFHKLPRDTHKDPFDRLLIWQAIQNKFTIISKDKRFEAYSDFGLNVFW